MSDSIVNLRSTEVCEHSSMGLNEPSWADVYKALDEVDRAVDTLQVWVEVEELCTQFSQGMDLNQDVPCEPLPKSAVVTGEFKLSPEMSELCTEIVANLEIVKALENLQKNGNIYAISDEDIQELHVNAQEAIKVVPTQKMQLKQLVSNECQKNPTWISECNSFFLTLQKHEQSLSKAFQRADEKLHALGDSDCVEWDDWSRHKEELRVVLSEVDDLILMYECILEDPM